MNEFARKNGRIVFAAVFLAFLYAFPALEASAAENPNLKTPTADLASQQQSEIAYVIGPQNVLQIKIYGEANVNQIYRVDELGNIKHALVGRVELGGLTVSEAERKMEETLEGDYIINPHVTIFVLEHSRFSIIGEVKKPGAYEILGRVSIIEAISMAGGFTPVADERAVKIQRNQEGKKTTIQVDTTRITQRGDLSAQVYIEADDVVVVPKSFF